MAYDPHVVVTDNTSTGFIAGHNAREVAMVVGEAVQETIVQVFERNKVFSELIETKRTNTKEKDIRWKAHYSSNPSAGSYSETDTLGINRTDLAERYAEARLDWKLNKVIISVTGLAQAISSSPNAMFDVLAENTEQALEQLAHNMNFQFLSDGAGNLNGAMSTLSTLGKDITGILAIIDDGSEIPTYAGINRGTYTWWQALVYKNPIDPGTARPISEMLFHALREEFQTTRAMPISHAFCSPQVFTQFGALLGIDRRYNTNASAAGSPLGYIGGFEKLRFNNIDLIEIPHYQNGRVDFLNIADLSYHILKDIEVAARDPGDTDSVKFVANTYSQLQHRKPRATASIRDIQTQ